MADASKPEPVPDAPGDAAIRATFLHTDEEWEVVKQLRAKVGDVEAAEYWKSEQCLHRFVRARKLDLDAAEAQYREAMHWRQVGFKIRTPVTSLRSHHWALPWSSYCTQLHNLFPDL